MAKKSRACMEMEIMIDELFETIEGGYLPTDLEVRYIMGYIDQKLVELTEKIEVPDFFDDEEDDDEYYD